jgi:cytidylate kinase
MPNRVIAIDGPSASGKSTVAKRVAATLGRLYVDSGAVYRAVTWHALQRNIVKDAIACAKLARETHIECFVKEGAVRFKIDGLELVSELRSAVVNENVSLISAMPEVRIEVVACLRKMLRFGDLVMEGRDIGSAVFPDAEFKFYLDANPGERARRRTAELAASGVGDKLSVIHESLQRRDTIDSSRKNDPLKIAPGAIILDTTKMSVDDVAQQMLSRINGNN